MNPKIIELSPHSIGADLLQRTRRIGRRVIVLASVALLVGCVAPPGVYRRHERREDRHDWRQDRREDRRDWREDRRDDRYYRY